MTPTDRALPRRKATPLAETPTAATGLSDAVSPYVRAADGPAAGPARRPGPLRAAMALSLVLAALGAAAAVGSGFAPPASESAAVPEPTAAVPEPSTDDVATSTAPELGLQAAHDAARAVRGGRADGIGGSATDAVADEAAAALDPEVASPTSAPAPSSTAAPKPVAKAAAAVPTTALPAATVPPTAPPTTAKPVATAPPTTAAPATTVAPAPIGGNDAATLACIRKRESGGNYSVVSANGLYYGAYQFMLSTWDSTARHAGRGDLAGKKPNLVAPADQDAMALHLLHWQGLAPWGGYCG